MKTSKITLLAGLIMVGIILGCKEEEPQLETQPFEAKFFTVLVSMAEDAICAAPHNFLNTQEGNGTSILIGKFTTQIIFCVDPNTLEYEDAQGSFVAENGEKIFFTGSGHILPSDEPGYDLEFRDHFTITGGTGRFEDASGNLTSNSFVNLTTQQTDHVWTGTVTLMK